MDEYESSVLSKYNLITASSYKGKLHSQTSVVSLCFCYRLDVLDHILGGFIGIKARNVNKVLVYAHTEHGLCGLPLNEYHTQGPLIHKGERSASFEGKVQSLNKEAMCT
jgi:hypothetical protein